jgi:hypothetical protein
VKKRGDGRLANLLGGEDISKEDLLDVLGLDLGNSLNGSYRLGNGQFEKSANLTMK